MSQFTSFTSVMIPSKFSEKFILTEDLVYEHHYEGSGLYIVAPMGTETDFASIPWILQVFWKPYDARWNKPAILHDYLWTRARTLREYQDANDVFYESMLVTGTPKPLAILAYLSVSVSKYYFWIRKKLTGQRSHVKKIHKF